MHSDQLIISKVLSNGRWKYGDTNDPAARQAYQSLIHVSYLTTEKLSTKLFKNYYHAL